MQKELTHNLPELFKEEGLRVFVCQAKSLDEKYIYQLIERSRQPHVMKFERREDAEGRFKNIDAYKTWAKKGRVVYILTDKNGEDLGGIIWFGKKLEEHIDKKYELTFGIRLYENYVGRRLSKPLMNMTHENVITFFGRKYIWLDFSKYNEIAGKAYESFGYKVLMKTDNRIIMGKKL